jgi:N-acylneuraminate cytidylyltransferase/CMP-N,N'-diacetyllegionaminic acid synthase
MFILGIIPARRGSVTIKRKDIYEICGKKLIEYTVDETKKVYEDKIIDDYVISTDDETILSMYPEKCQERPFELSQGEPGSILNVVPYVIKTYEKDTSNHVDAFVLLQPTNPMRSCEDIKNAISMFKESNNGEKVTVYFNTTFGEYAYYFKPYCDNLVSVHETTAIKRYYDFEFKPMGDQKTTHDKNKDKPMWVRNGAIFITRRDLLEKGRIFNEEPLCYIMPKSRSIDIDDMEDMFIAESLIKNGVLK